MKNFLRNLAVCMLLAVTCLGVKAATFDTNKDYYVDVSAVSWFHNAGAIVIIWDAAQNVVATQESTNLYKFRVTNPNQSSIYVKRCDPNAHGTTWNEYILSADNNTSYNRFTFNSDFKGGTWSSYNVGPVTPTVVTATMPLTPADFKDGRKHYFLVGPPTAIWRLQPEWELTVSGNTATLPNALLYTQYFGIGVVDNYNDYAQQRYTLYATPAGTSNDIAGNTTKSLSSKGNAQHFNNYANLRNGNTVGRIKCVNGSSTDKPVLASLSVTLSNGMPT